MDKNIFYLTIVNPLNILHLSKQSVKIINPDLSHSLIRMLKEENLVVKVVIVNYWAGPVKKAWPWAVRSAVQLPIQQSE